MLVMLITLLAAGGYFGKVGWRYNIAPLFPPIRKSVISVISIVRTVARQQFFVNNARRSVVQALFIVTPSAVTTRNGVRALVAKSVETIILYAV